MSKTLVAYYSASGTTKFVAEEIARELSADLFEITPDPAYSDADLNYMDDSSRVCEEYHDESKRNIGLNPVTPENWSDYDTVFISYPIWWAIAAWPASSFANQNDFTGKTVYPFATSMSSPLGESAELLKTETGSWQPGHRFGMSASPAEISGWLSSLNLK